MYNDMSLNETGWCQAMIHGEAYRYNNVSFDKPTYYVFGLLTKCTVPHWQKISFDCI